jgi:DNA-3-methyladenine glycosylase II
MPAKADARVKRFTMKPVPPFDFDLSARIFSDGDPQFRTYDGGLFHQLLRIDGRLILCTISNTGTVEAPGLKIELRSDGELSAADVRRARAMVDSMFNLEIDLKPFYRAVKGDPVMSRLAGRMYGLKSPTTPTVFEALVDSIIEQQISLIAAHSMQKKLIRAFGDRLELDGETYYAYPTPEKLASVSVDKIRACGLSGKKSEYIKDISMMVAAGTLDLDKFESYDDIDEIRGELKAIRGIGAWTAEMTMIRGLHKMDSIPADDIGLQAKISHFYGKAGRVSSDELRQVAQGWGKWRGLGGYYLIMAHHQGLE